MDKAPPPKKKNAFRDYSFYLFSKHQRLVYPGSFNSMYENINATKKSTGISIEKSKNMFIASDQNAGQYAFIR
jgi:hypothetical protein